MNHQSNARQDPQAVDATIYSVDSMGDGLGSMMKACSRPEGKVKAYVDFSEFNKSYEEYLKNKGKKDKESKDSSKDSGTGTNSSRASEDWEILS